MEFGFASREGECVRWQGDRSSSRATSLPVPNQPPGSLNSGDMQTKPAERRRPPGRGRRAESGRLRAEPRGPEASSGKESARWKEIIVTMQQNEKSTGGRGRRAERTGDDEEEERERGRRASLEGGDSGEESNRLRWKVNQLEKDKLQLTSSYNQELCRLQAELARLRSLLEGGKAQRAELQYQLTASCRDAERAAELSRDKLTVTARATELQQTVDELQKALHITRQARGEEQHALQQDVEECDRLIQSFSLENQRLHRLLQDQEEALEESERRMAEVQKEREEEAEVNRRQADKLKYVTDREERGRREKELSDQRVKSLESSIEAERAAHLESKFNSEIIQLRVRDLEAAVAVERSGQQEVKCSLEMLRAQFREVERAYSLERKRSSNTEHTRQRLQTEYELCKSDMSVALETERKTTSGLSERLEDEKRRHADTQSQLDQAAQRQADTQEAFMNRMKQIRDTLQQHSTQPAKDDGKQSPAPDVLQLLRTTLSSYQHRLEVSDKQLQAMQQENETLRQLASNQSSRTHESQQVSVRLKEEVARLHQESSDWSTQSESLQAELRKMREKMEKEREEREKEREERAAEVQKIIDHYETESTAQLYFLYRLYQRLLAGCVLLDQPQSVLGNFTWEQLCDVISEQVDDLTSDLRKASKQVIHLQSVCDKKSVCVRELQRGQECVLSRLQESVRRREEAWSSQHTHTVSRLQEELQLCRSQCDSLQEHTSSLELRCSSLTSDLSRLQRLLSRKCQESSSFFLACAMLAGALQHTHRRLSTLSEQKIVLSRRLAERERLEEEVRRLTDALGGEKDKEEEERRGRRRRVLRRWRKSVCAVLAVRRWWVLARKTTVLFRVERGGVSPDVCVCGESATATQDGPGDPEEDDDDEGRDGVCARWLRSKWLSSAILSSMSDLQGALAHTGSTPPDVISAARSGVARLLDHLLDQSESTDKDTLSSRLRLGLSRLMAPQPDAKTLVSALQQHFLLFSQRLHSAEVERRGLRLEVTNLTKGLRQEREEMVASERFHSVCSELRQALSREQEAQLLIQEQSNQLHTLQCRVDTHTAEQADTQRTLTHTTQAMSDAQQEVSKKDRSLRILGKHLLGVQRQRRQLEERLQRAEDELRDAARRHDCVIVCMKAAEASCKQVRDGLVHSQRSLSAQPRPLLLPWEHLELSRAESIMGAADMAACKSFLSVVTQLCHTCSSRIDWLEQEVSSHHSHMTTLRGEQQDACLHDNLAFVPVAELPETVPFADVAKDTGVICSTAPSLLLSKPIVTKAEKKATKKNRGR